MPSLRVPFGLGSNVKLLRQAVQGIIRFIRFDSARMMPRSFEEVLDEEARGEVALEAGPGP